MFTFLGVPHMTIDSILSKEFLVTTAFSDLTFFQYDNFIYKRQNRKTEE